MKKYTSKLLVLFLIVLLILPIGCSNTNKKNTIQSFDINIAETENTAKQKLMILHTNNVQGNVNNNINHANLLQLSDEYKSMGYEVIVLDTGNAFYGYPEAIYTKGNFVGDIMNKTNYSATTLGNLDFNYSLTHILNLSQELNFPILVANVFYEITGEPIFTSNTIINVNNTKIGIFGLTAPNMSANYNANNIKISEKEELYKVAQSQINELKSNNCDIIIAIGSLGTEEFNAGNTSIDVIKNTRGIDLFVDGGNQEALEKDTRINKTLLVRSGENFDSIGEVLYDGEIFTSNIKQAPLSKNKELENYIQQELKKIHSELAKVIIGNTEIPLNAKGILDVAQVETNMGDLITDAMLYMSDKKGCTSEIALLNNISIKNDINKGNISAFEIIDAISKDTIIVMDIPGYVIKEILKENAKLSAPDNIIQVSGINYILDKTEIPNQINITNINGELFSEEKIYTVVTTNTLVKNNDNYQLLKDYYKGDNIGVTLTQTVSDYISTKLNKKILASQYETPQGRITIIEQN